MSPILGFTPSELTLPIGYLTPTKGAVGGASRMYNTPQYLPAEIQDNAQTLSMNPIMFANPTVLSHIDPEW